MFVTTARRIVTNGIEKRSPLQCLIKQKSSIAASADIIDDSVKKFDDIPAPPEGFLFGHLQQFLKKENAERLDQFFGDLQRQYGDVVRLRIPGGMGNGNMVALFTAKDIKTMYGLEERIPKLPGASIHIK